MQNTLPGLGISAAPGFVFGNPPLPDSAISNEAAASRSALSSIARDSRRSVTLSGRKGEAVSELFNLAAECSIDDWDCSGAKAISLRAVWTTQKFIYALPTGFPMPEFAAEPDGAISLDWIESKNRFFSLSIGSSNRLAYAWIDGSDKGHAVARFDGIEIPHRVLSGIREIVKHDDTPVRAA